MKIKIGDRVRFLNDVGEGRVIGFQNGNIVEVRTGDGWDIPYPVNELIVFPDEENTGSYKPEPLVEDKQEDLPAGEVTKASGEVDPADVMALFVMKDHDRPFSGLRIYLVNESENYLYFTFYAVYSGRLNLILRDTLEPGTKILLDEPGLDKLSELKAWHFQGLFYADEYGKLPPMIDMPVPFNVKKFSSSGAYQENDYLHDPAIKVPLLPDLSALLADTLESTDIEKIKYLKERGNLELNQPRVFSSGNADRPPREIDLHINQLVDRVVGLSNREILNIQMGTFHRELNTAVSAGESSIVFIHGIGNGTLKQELRNAVDKEYDACFFEDASFREYGFGATLVRIRHNK